MAVAGGRVAALDDPVGVTDMCLLEPLTEGNFITNLKHRFDHDQIYTYIGNVVISVNPYKKLPLYSKDVIFEYKSQNFYELPPHIYAIADDAYRSMRDRNLDQCVIISGESGSGKTEASKVIMQYVAAVSGKGRDIDRVKEQLLQSNPVLEAFGNAKTNRNDNSSRFGKYMDIEFDFKGDPIGGVITNYLLEKSRVTFQARAERSFHIFYQLLSGADTSFLKSLKLHRNPDHYLFLRPGMCTQIESVDDKEDYQVSKFQRMANGFTDSGTVSHAEQVNFETTTTAMEVIGFQREEIAAVFQLVACVLKLGNLQFQHHSNIDGTDGCKLNNEDEVYEVCDLLSCDIEVLFGALKQRTVQTVTDHVKTDLSSTEATYARDALCKAMYSRMFSWLVTRINDSIRVRTRGKRKSIGVLDIYGFEIFEDNGFEQFIINYCNEKLQQIFIELTLKEEQEEYISEGIEWINVEYFNNAVICDLIEKTNVGMLAMLDEECLRPGKVTDGTFLEKLNQTCSSHPHYESRGCRKTQSDRSLPHDAFRLIHYAGAVTYKVEGFIDKNNDLLFRDLSRVMYQCSHPLLKQLFPEGNPERTSRKRPATAGSQFKMSVGELMKNLLCKCPNYIRCVKPNDYKRHDLFDMQIVKHQVRYLGLMENVRVRRAGYAYRQQYEQFLYRYKMLSRATWPFWRGVPREGVEQIFIALSVPKEEYAFGKTKIFIRNPSTLFMMEDHRRARLHDLATLIQTAWRGWHQMMLYLRMKRSQILISSQYRGYKAKTKFRRIRLATITLCTYYRGWKARELLKELKYRKKCLWAVGIIHKYYLGWMVRREYRSKFRAIAGPKIIKFLQQALRYRFLTELSKKLPSMSPIDKTWPACSPMYYYASEELRVVYHRWRCEQFRAKCDKHTKNWMREKVAASDIFLNKKSYYPNSVNHPFKGDYVSLRQNTKWKKIACETNDQHLVFADIVMKVNRSNGKMVPQLVVLSTNAMLILDQRTLVIKYRIPVTAIDAMSLSPYNDKLVLVHIRKAQENGDILTKKGDFLLSSDHVIEIVAKLYLLVQNATTHKPPVNIDNQFDSMMNGHSVSVSFNIGMPDVLPGAVKIIRKGSKMDIMGP